MAPQPQPRMTLDAHDPTPAMGRHRIGEDRTAEGAVGDHNDRGGGWDDLADAIEQGGGIGPEGGGTPGIAGMEHPRERDGATMLPNGGSEQGSMVGVGGLIKDDGHGVGGRERAGGGEDGALERPR